MIEDIDAILNTAKEDKLMILGMIRKIPRPTGKDKIRRWLNDNMLEVLNSIKPEVSSELTFVSQGRKPQ
jgi:hypothetical protein